MTRNPFFMAHLFRDRSSAPRIAPTGRSVKDATRVLGCRTMADTADVVVVGGGVIGTSIAFALASAGVKRVTLLEKGALASGASGRSSALIRMHYVNEEDARLAWASFPVFRDWRERMGGPPVFTQTGFVAVVGHRDAWAPRLCREIGIALDARPKALDTMLVTRPPEIAKPHMVVIDHVLGTYFRPEGDAQTIVGVPCQVWDIDPDTMPTGLPPSAPVEGAQMLTHRMPAMERAALSRGYRAFDCYSADRHAILGAVRGVDGLYLATAFSGSGFKIAPAVGACLAELITEGRARTVDISAFRPERFAEGRPIAGRHPYAPRRDHVEPTRSA